MGTAATIDGWCMYKWHIKTLHTNSTIVSLTVVLNLIIPVWRIRIIWPDPNHITGSERTKDPYFLVDCEANTNIVLNQILTVRIPKFFPVILVFLFCFRIFWMCPKIFCPTQTIVYGCCGELNFSVRLLTPPPTPSCFPNPVFLVHFRSFFLWAVHFSRRFPCCLQKRRSMS